MLGNQFDVSPDGRRFLFTRALDSAASRPDELVLVQNLFDELNAKVKKK